MSMTFDAQAALGFVVSQASHIEREVNETVYPDIQYPGLIPIDTSAHPWAQTVTYYSSDKVGKAGWISGNANDMPLASTELAEHKTAVHMAGIGYSFGYEELNTAQMLGRNLQTDDAMAARRGYEEMVDRVALYGDAEKNFKGLINNAGVTAGSATNGDWDNATEDQILQDVNDLLFAVPSGTAYTSMADTLLLPYPKMNYLATNRLGDTEKTLLEFLRKNNTYTAMTGQPLTTRTVRGLDTAGAGGINRMIAYRRNPQVLKMHIPMPHQFLRNLTYREGLNFVVPGVFRLGGVDIRRPKEVRYGDGI